MKKKLISLLLVLALVFQISGGALAAVGNYLGNTPAQNQEIYDQLAALTGGTSEEARALLDRLGLLDENGNLDLTANITMDGKSMTVDEVRNMLGEPGTDLSKIVNVDGTSVSLRDLQTMLNIEAELARIQNTYFSGKTFGADATDNLNSLMNQIETRGIGLHSEPTAAGGASAAADNAPKAADDEPYLEFSTNRAKVPAGESGSFTLALKNGPLSKPGEFNMRLVDRTLDELTYTFSANDENRWNEIPLYNTLGFTIPAGEANWKMEVKAETTEAFKSELSAATNYHMGYLAFSSGDDGIVKFTPEHLSEHTVCVRAQRAAEYFSWAPMSGGAYFSFQPSSDTGDAPLPKAVYDDYAKGDFEYKDNYLKIPMLPKAPASILSTQQNKEASLWLALEGQDLQKRGIQLEMSADIGILNSVMDYQHGWDRKSNAFVVGDKTLDRFASSSSGPVVRDPVRHLDMYTKPMLYTAGDAEPLPIDTYTVKYEDSASAVPVGENEKAHIPIQMTSKMVADANTQVWSVDAAPPYRAKAPQSSNLTWLISGDKEEPEDSFWTTLCLKTDVPSVATTLPVTENGLYLLAPLAIEDTYFTNDHGGVGNHGPGVVSEPFSYHTLHTALSEPAPGNPVGNGMLFYIRGGYVKVTEKVAPKVVSVTTPYDKWFRTYSTGQTVPVKVTFDEPVQCDGLSITPLNGGGTLSCGCRNNEAPNGISAGTTHVFEYKVQKVDAATLQINQISGIKDVFGNTATDKESRAVEGITLYSTLMEDAVTGAAPAKASLTPIEAGTGTSLTLTLEGAEAYQTKYASYDPKAHKAPFVARPRGFVGDDVSFTLVEDANRQITGAAAPTGALAFDTEAKTYTYDILAYNQYGNTWSTTPVPTGKSVTVAVQPMVFANVDKVTYPKGDKDELSLTAPEVPTLGVDFKNPAPTFTSGTWESSDKDIATIATVEGKGQVTLAGKKLGKVHFTFTADDGALGKIDPAAGKVKTVTSKEYTVTAGGEAGIVVPKGGNIIIAQEKSEAQVRWYGNMAQYLEPAGSEHVKYTVEVFDGNFAPDTDFTGKTPVHTAKDLPMDTNSCKIPADVLKTLSVGATPAYTVRISAPHPKAAVAENGIRLYAYAYIIVSPVPVTVKLTQPEKLYALDSRTAPIAVDWSIANYKTGITDAALTVERVPEKGKPQTFSTQKITAESGTASFTPAKVEGLRDLYVVTVAAKNDSDSVWNSDSYQFYVYKDGALKIVVGENKEQKDSVTLSNRENPLAITPPTSTEDIMALRGLLGLNTPLGINYDEYAWSALKDGIKWESSDKTKVGLNFKQGSFYEDIERFNYDSYLPATTMAISGTGETEKTVITATHANTGMSTAIDVKVESLQNKLYLFQTTPMMKTTLTYTDSKGAKKSIDTNDSGTLALYEPNGIDGAVYFRGVDASDDNALYLGTMFPGSLRSGEGNTLVRELYPMNSFTLRRVARTDLFLKKPDGTPYAGTVTVRGGVYKNGNYCQAAQLGINNADLQAGTASKTVTTAADGKLTVQMDSTQFWSAAKGETAKTELQAIDKLEYIFELTGITAGGMYCPVLAYVDGVSPVALGTRTGEGVFTLEAAAGEGVFLANQRSFDKNGDVRSVRYRPDILGPNEVTPKGTELQSTMLLWGEKDIATKDYSVQLLDEFGFRPSAQKSETITYPFSSIPVVRNTMDVTPQTLTQSGWVPAGQPRGIKLQVLKKDTLQKDIPTDIKVADLSKVPPLKGETTTNIIADMNIGSGVGVPTEMSHKNKVVDGLMKRLSGGGNESISGPVNASNFKMIISPGDDSATFKAFIWAGHNSLGLENATYDDKGISVTPHLLEDELSTGFDDKAGVDLAVGGKDATKSGADLAKSGKSVADGAGFGGQLEGFYECLVKFNFKTQQWEIFTLGGGFTVGFGGSFGKSISQFVGPIPITASFELGAAIQLDFKMASRYKVMGTGLEWSEDYQDKQYVSDFLTTLRINAYFEAFGGIGFDISIVALKFGVFGRLEVDNSNAFLSRPYLANKELRQTNGQALKLRGEVGIQFVLTVIGIIDYKATLASVDMTWSKTFNQWNAIQDYWKTTGSGLEKNLSSIAAYGAQNGLTLVDASAKLQSRDYLSDFERSWGAPPRRGRALDPTNGLTALQKNAYPNSLPRVTDDGKYLLYTSEQGSADDLTSARIYVSEKGADGAYPEGTLLDAPEGFTSYGDSDLCAAGKGDLAAAAWVSQNTNHKLTPGQEVTANVQSVLTNATDIIASVNTGGTWVSTRLTENGSPDLAPVVAASDEKAIVAWRSVYAADAENPMDFTAQDKVLYKIYDKTTDTWGDAQTLYPGTSGVVKGMEAAMLPDGTAAVTYVLDRSGIGTASTYEVAAAIVKADGTPGRTLMLTSDDVSDENPQIAAVDCGAAGAPDPRFVIGWYSTKGEGGDIRMAALDAEGLPSAAFPESLGQIAKETAIGNNFRFVAADKLEELSVLWSATSQDQTQKGDQLLAVKLLPQGDKIGLSAPIDVATLPANTNTDHFDAYASAPGELKAVIQGTEYAPVDKSDPNTYELYTVADEDEDGNEVQREVYVPKAQTMLFTATETYANKMTLTQVWADYENLALNSLLPVQFTVQNSGFETLDSVCVTLGDKTQDFPVKLAPNGSTTLTLYHTVGTAVEDIPYSITPAFASGALAPTADTLHLDYPDLGIASLKVLSEKDGKRDLRVTLYNGAAAKLQKTDRTINLAFYDNSLFEGDAVDVTYGGAPAKKIIISEQEQLALADKGALCADVSFDADAYLTAKALKEHGEIPAAGLRLYAKAWVEDGENELPEFRAGNNTASVQLDSLLSRAGEPVTITVAQGLTEDGKSTAAITVRNNSLKSVNGSGNVTATLLDKNGKVLETQQSYQPESRAIDGGLITLGAEESETVNFTFGKAGASVKVTYGALVLSDDKNAELTGLSATGIPVRLGDFKADKKDPAKFTAAIATAAGETLITALAKDPGAAVTVNGAAMPKGGTPMSLSPGENKITIVITARDGVTKRTYELLAERTTSDPSDEELGTYTITAAAGVGGSIAPRGTSAVSRGVSKTYTITPNKGYVLADVLVDGASVGKVPSYTFEKVTKNHTIEARFASADLAFTDVTQSDWFYTAVDYAVRRELMKGEGNGCFNPMDSSSRAMIATVLYRMAGAPAAPQKTPFADVPAGQWYSDAIAWAAENGVAQGYHGLFDGEASVTREQLAQFFYNYEALQKHDLSKADDLTAFSDAPTGWSRPAMAWAVGSGIVSGKGGGRLDPEGTATRAELAAMLMRLLEKK